MKATCKQTRTLTDKALEDFNENHGEGGRFASEEGGSSEVKSLGQMNAKQMVTLAAHKRNVTTTAKRMALYPTRENIKANAQAAKTAREARRSMGLQKQIG